MTESASPLDGRMVFAFGVPRSGTFWLQRILTAHPQVASVPNETHLFSDVIAPFLTRFHHGASASPSISTIYADRRMLIERLRALCDGVLGAHLTDGARLLSERSPWHVRHVGLIAELYPDGRFLHIIRDPRDVARSMVAHDWGPEHLAEAAEQWRDSIRLARAARAPRYLEVRYERVLGDVPAAAREIYDWLGLDASADVLAAAAADAEVHVNVDPARTEVGLAKWRAHLSPEQVREIEEVAGELMTELGYELSGGQGATGGPARRPARTRARGALRRLGRARLDQSDQPDHDPVTAAATFDRLLTAIHSGDADLLADLLADDATVRTLSADGAELLRDGAAGLQALQQAVADDPAFRGEQVDSTVHSTFPTTVGLLSYRLDDGSLARRILVASARGDRIVHVTVQRL